MRNLTERAEEKVTAYYNALLEFKKKNKSYYDVKVQFCISRSSWFINQGFAIKNGKFYDIKDGITKDDIYLAFGYEIPKIQELPIQFIDSATIESMHSRNLIESSYLKKHWKNLTESDLFLGRCFHVKNDVLVISLGSTQREVYIEQTTNKTGHEEPFNSLKRTLYKFNPIRNKGKVYNRCKKGYWLVPVDCLDIVPLEQPKLIEVIAQPLVINKVTNDIPTATSLSFRGDLAKCFFDSLSINDLTERVDRAFYIADLFIKKDNI